MGRFFNRKPKIGLKDASKFLDDKGEVSVDSSDYSDKKFEIAEKIRADIEADKLKNQDKVKLIKLYVSLLEGEASEKQIKRVKQGLAVKKKEDVYKLLATAVDLVIKEKAKRSK